MDSVPQNIEEYFNLWEQQAGVPFGTCWCGCGEKTWVSGKTDRAVGYIRGQPVFFRRGHQARRDQRGDLWNCYSLENKGHSTPCWAWQERKNKAGYGIWFARGRTTVAHRLFYERRFGKVEEGMVLDHLCQYKGCVNPSHLEVVTAAENKRRGKGVKLNMEKANEIRKLYAAGEHSYNDLTRIFGVSMSCIYSVVKGKSWGPPKPFVTCNGKVINSDR